MKVAINWEKAVYESFEEEQSSQILTMSQEKRLKNLLLDSLQEKLTMSIEVENYLTKQEYLRGQVDILLHVLAISQEARSAMSVQQTSLELPI